MPSIIHLIAEQSDAVEGDRTANRNADAAASVAASGSMRRDGCSDDEEESRHGLPQRFHPLRETMPVSS